MEQTNKVGTVELWSMIILAIILVCVMAFMSDVNHTGEKTKSVEMDTLITQSYRTLDGMSMKYKVVYEKTMEVEDVLYSIREETKMHKMNFIYDNGLYPYKCNCKVVKIYGPKWYEKIKKDISDEVEHREELKTELVELKLKQKS